MSTIMDLLKEDFVRPGTRLTRDAWCGDVRLINDAGGRIGNVHFELEITKSERFVVHSEGGQINWTPTIEELIADDWHTVGRLMIAESDGDSLIPKRDLTSEEQDSLAEEYASSES